MSITFSPSDFGIDCQTQSEILALSSPKPWRREPGFLQQAAEQCGKEKQLTLDRVVVEGAVYDRFHFCQVVL